MSRVWRVDLPITTPPLRDNDRPHWAVKARETAKLRTLSWALAIDCRIPQLDRARIVLHWRPATRRRRDQLSIAPTLKPLVDGLIDAGVLPDDDSEHAEVSCRIEPVATMPALWLTIEDLSSDAPSGHLAATDVDENGLSLPGVPHDDSDTAESRSALPIEVVGKRVSSPVETNEGKQR